MKNHNCADIQEQLILLDELEAQEREAAIEAANGCDECRDIYQKQQVIMNALYETGNGDSDAAAELTRYLHYLTFPGEPDYDGKQMTDDEAKRIATKIEDNPLLKMRFERQKSELGDLAAFLNDSLN